MKPLRVLVADDDADGQEIIARYLRRYGHEAVCVSDGRACVERAITEPFDLVLLDMDMPSLNGWQAAEQIRVRRRYEDLPIVALTAYAMQGDREKCLDAGCTDYLTKPIDFAALASILQRQAD